MGTGGIARIVVAVAVAASLLYAVPGAGAEPVTPGVWTRLDGNGSLPGMGSSAAGFGKTSARGDVLAFETDEAILSEDTNDREDLYIVRGATGEVISPTLQDSTLTDDSNFGWFQISDDGSGVVFAWAYDGLVAGDANGERDVFLYDLDTSELHWVSRSNNPPSKHSLLGWDIAISPDGSKVTFTSNFDLDDQDSVIDSYAYIYDAGSRARTLLPMQQPTTNGQQFGYVTDLSADGRYVVYLSGNHDHANIYRLDRNSTTHDIIATGVDGTCTGDIQMSDDGNSIVFHSCNPRVTNDSPWWRILLWKDGELGVIGHRCGKDAGHLFECYTDYVLSGSGDYLFIETATEPEVPWPTTSGIMDLETETMRDVGISRYGFNVRQIRPVWVSDDGQQAVFSARSDEILETRPSVQSMFLWDGRGPDDVAPRLRWGTGWADGYKPPSGTMDQYDWNGRKQNYTSMPFVLSERSKVWIKGVNREYLNPDAKPNCWSIGGGSIDCKPRKPTTSKVWIRKGVSFERGQQEFKWKGGRDTKGRRVNGIYKVTLWAKDPAGNLSTRAKAKAMPPSPYK